MSHASVKSTGRLLSVVAHVCLIMRPERRPLLAATVGDLVDRDPARRLLLWQWVTSARIRQPRDLADLGGDHGSAGAGTDRRRARQGEHRGGKRAAGKAASETEHADLLPRIAFLDLRQNDPAGSPHPPSKQWCRDAGKASSTAGPVIAGLVRPLCTSVITETVRPKQSRAPRGRPVTVPRGARAHERRREGPPSARNAVTHPARPVLPPPGGHSPAALRRDP